MIEGRNVIVWLGENDAPQELREVISANGLELLIVDRFSKIGDFLQRSKGLIIEGEPTLLSNALRAALPGTGQHGVPIAVISSDSSDQQWFLRITSSKSIKKLLVNAEIGKEVDGVRDIHEYFPSKPGEWIRLIKRFLEFRHGPIYSDNLQIKEDVSVKKYHQDYIHDKFLMRRAFSEYEHIEVSSLAAGHSGARVYKITPIIKGYARNIPFLIKIDTPGRIAQEKDVIEKIVAKTIYFQHRPNLFPHLCFATQHYGVLVQDFVQNAITFRQAVQHGRAAVLMTSLFEDALRPWRLNPSHEGRDVMTLHFFPNGRFKCSEDLRHLEESFNWAISEGTADLNPEKLLIKLKSCFPNDVETGRIHGDLHCRNIFVGAASHDVILIDFYTSSTNGTGPLVSDPACLEVDIAFRSGCPVSFLKGLYLPPLLPPPPPEIGSSFSWVWEAIRAVRLFGRVNGQERAYTIAVAAYLLKFASYEDNGPIEVRGMAYDAAEKLITSLCP